MGCKSICSACVIKMTVGKYDGVRWPFEILFRPIANQSLREWKCRIDERPGTVGMSDAKNIYEHDSKPLNSGGYRVELDDLVFRDVNAIHTVSRTNLWLLEGYVKKLSSDTLSACCFLTTLKVLRCCAV